MKSAFTIPLLVIFLFANHSLSAQFKKYDNGRIAMSMDGNSAPDDWGVSGSA